MDQPKRRFGGYHDRTRQKTGLSLEFGVWSLEFGKQAYFTEKSPFSIFNFQLPSHP